MNLSECARCCSAAAVIAPSPPVVEHTAPRPAACTDVMRGFRTAASVIIQGDTGRLPRTLALVVGDDTTLVVRGVRISGTRGRSAIKVGHRAHLRVSRCVLDDNTGALVRPAHTAPCARPQDRTARARAWGRGDG